MPIYIGERLGRSRKTFKNKIVEPHCSTINIHSHNTCDIQNISKTIFNIIVLLIRGYITVRRYERNTGSFKQGLSRG